MVENAVIFWIVGSLTLLGGVFVVLLANPIYSALSLVLTMIGVASLFVTLNAHFLAGVQLIVYAGAVTVLFVMVLMLFNLKQELRAFTSGGFSRLVKIGVAGVMGGLIAGAVLSGLSIDQKTMDSVETTGRLAINLDEGSKNLGRIIFTKYVFGFEALGVLLLIVAVGAVALARSRGGTHAKH